jgi:hypothetical protein
MAGQQRGYRGDESVRAEIADDRALALAGLDQSDKLQDADGVADRRPADTKSLGEFSFGRQAITSAQPAIGDQTLDLGNNFFIDTSPPDWCQLICNWGSVGGDWIPSTNVREWSIG